MKQALMARCWTWFSLFLVLPSWHQPTVNFGRIGHYAGEFVFLHNVATDSKGNVYTSEVGTGRRAQKFVRLAAR